METAKIYRLNGQRFERRLPEDGSPSVSQPKPKLLEQVRQAIRSRHYSSKTEEAYVGWIKRFIFFHNKRHPLEWRRLRSGNFCQALRRTGM